MFIKLTRKLHRCYATKLKLQFRLRVDFYKPLFHFSSMFTDVIDMVSVLLSTIQLIDMSGSSVPNSDSQRYWSLAKRLQVFLICFSE